MNLTCAGVDQAAALARLHALAFEHPWTAAAFTTLLEGAGVFAVLAEMEGPAGAVLCRALVGEAEVLTLAVAPSARRSGVAQSLMTAAMRLSRQAGAEAMFLEVGAGNAAAIALYSKLGFVQTGRRRSYYDRGAEGLEDALVMRLDLIASAR